MFYEIKDSRMLSGDEMDLCELRVLREKVGRYYEEGVIEGVEMGEEWEWLEDRLCDVCRSGIVGDFRLFVEEWELIEEI